MTTQESAKRDDAGERRVKVEIFADVICPWCYIGKRRLDAAFRKRPHVKPEYVWRAFLLNPTIPATGMDRKAYLIGKFGTSVAAVYGRIAAAGLDSGIAFNFDRIARTPDSRMAQRMLIVAGPDSYELSEIMYQAYFIEGRDIGDMAELARIAERFGRPGLLDEAKSDEVALQMENDVVSARAMRLDGVPCFVFDGTYSISGAHMPEHIIPTIDAVAA